MAKVKEKKVLGIVRFLCARMYLYDDDTMVGVRKIDTVLSNAVKFFSSIYFWIREKLNPKYKAEYKVVVLDWYAKK